MANLIPTPVCTYDELSNVIFRPKRPSAEEIQNHPGNRFDLEGLTTPVFHTQTYESSQSFGFAPPFGHLRIYGSFATGNPFYNSRVYLGVDDEHGTHEYSIHENYAVKVRDRSESDQEDFQRELSLRLSHRNLTSVIGAGSLADGRLYGIMKFVNGISLKQGMELLRSYALNPDMRSVMARKRSEPLKIRPLARDDFASTHNSIRHLEKVISKTLTREQRFLLKDQFRQELLHSTLMVGEALCYLADQDLVHRDIKPGNILLVGDRDTIDPRVIDFGTCCRPLVVPGLKKHKVALNHMHSPEAVFGGEIDTRHDFFCLGTIMYAVATGKPPYSGDSPESEMECLARTPPAATGDSDLDSIILPMLSIDPAMRLHGRELVSAFSTYVRAHTYSDR